MSSLSIAHYFPFSRVHVLGQSVSMNEAEFAMIQIEPDKRFHPVCHECNGPAANVHSWTRRIVRDLNFASAEVWLSCRYRKIFCPRCDRVRIEGLELFEPYQRVTFRLARAIHELCKVMSVSDVAGHYGLDWKTVKNIDKAFLEERYAQTNYAGLRLLAVDEIAVHRGQSYMTVVIDFETGRVVWMGEGRTYETLSQFFQAMPPEAKQSIQAVAMDMWDPFIKAVREHVPNAQIVFDLYHVVAGFNKVIDQVRLSECRKARTEDKSVYKGSKYLLLTNSKNLRRRNHRLHLKELLELNATLCVMMILKEDLKRIWTYKSRAWALRRLRDWCAMARTLEHPEVRTFARMLEAHEYGILNHCDHPIHTSKLEGINNKIKLIKRRAFGYRDVRYFTLKVIQAFDPKPTN